MINNPILSQIEAFLGVAETGSFTSAAHQLQVSKSAISQSVSALENTLGVNLLIRTTRKVNLTDEGELFLAQCYRLKDELENTNHFIAQLHQTPSGTLRISCNPYLAETKLIACVDQYLKKFPSMKIEIFSEERMPDMIKEKIDIVFGVNWEAPLDIVAKKIGKTRYVFCASKKYLKKYGVPKKLTDLENHHYIPHLGRKNAIVGLKNDNHKLKFSSRLKINNANFMKQCAINGLGIVELHDYMVEKEITKGDLIEVLKNTTHIESPVYIYYQKNGVVQPKVREFIQFILK